ncbi:putative membrane protein [Bradyrhizobium sp. USDA 4341]
MASQVSETAVVQIGEAVDQAARRKTIQIVTAALKRAAVEIQSLPNPNLLFVGLWHAAISSLLINMDAADVADVLEHRSEKLLPASPSIDPAAEDERLRQISDIAAVISAELEVAFTACEAVGLEEQFPESVLDKAIEMLEPRWGADHLRAAMASQVALIAAGLGAVFPASEPAPSVRSLPASRREPSAGRPRAAVVRVEADVSGDQPLWAYAMVVTAADGSSREDLHEARCRMPGANLARTLMAGVLAALETISCEGPGAHVLLETSHNPFLLQASSPAARPSVDGSGWERIERLRETMQLDFRRAQPDQHQEIAARCLKLLRPAH